MIYFFSFNGFWCFLLHPTTSAPSDLSVLPLIDREPTALGLVGTWISHSAVPVAGFLRHAPGQLWSLLDDVRWDSDFDGALLQPCARHFEIGRSSTCPEANKRSSFKNGGPMIKEWTISVGRECFDTGCGVETSQQRSFQVSWPQTLLILHDSFQLIALDLLWFPWQSWVPPSKAPAPTNQTLRFGVMNHHRLLFDTCPQNVRR